MGGRRRSEEEEKLGGGAGPSEEEGERRRRRLATRLYFNNFLGPAGEVRWDLPIMDGRKPPPPPHTHLLYILKTHLYADDVRPVSPSVIIGPTICKGAECTSLFLSPAACARACVCGNVYLCFFFILAIERYASPKEGPSLTLRSLRGTLESFQSQSRHVTSSFEN